MALSNASSAKGLELYDKSKCYPSFNPFFLMSLSNKFLSLFINESISLTTEESFFLEISLN